MVQMNGFTKDELETIKYWCREDHELVSKVQYMIEHIERHEKTAAKFEEWNRQLKEQKID
jgi:Txe/YoeB family toxin of Txe-Axe toxin-antitoxin module